MRILVGVGTQVRHKHIFSQLAKNFEIAGVIAYKRTLVQPPKFDTYISSHEVEFEAQHLRDFKTFEQELLGKDICKFSEFNHLYVSDVDELNSNKVIEFCKSAKADVFFDYGTGFIREPLLKILPKHKINLHGGISPFYKGSATLLWPIFFRQPELLGVTFHELSNEIDGGAIYHHSRPVMKESDKPFHIGSKAILKAGEDVVKLFRKLKKQGELECKNQGGRGKLFMEKDYKPFVLKVAYENIESGIIREYLKNKVEIDKRVKLFFQEGLNGF